MKKTLLAFLCVALMSATVLAADNGVIIKKGSGPALAHVTNPSLVRTPEVVRPAGTKTIFSNLGPSSTNLYYDGDGWLVAGPASELGESQFIALPFTPAKNSTVTKIETSVGYLGAGANQFVLSLNNDDGTGNVGTVIEQKTMKNTPNFGSCCTLNKWTLKTSQAVVAGTQYWVVATTPASGKGDDYYGAWAFSNLDTFEYNIESSGWTNGLAFTGVPAGAVLGTIP